MLCTVVNIYFLSKKRRLNLIDLCIYTLRYWHTYVSRRFTNEMRRVRKPISLYRQKSSGDLKKNLYLGSCETKWSVMVFFNKNLFKIKKKEMKIIIVIFFIVEINRDNYWDFVWCEFFFEQTVNFFCWTNSVMKDSNFKVWQH